MKLIQKNRVKAIHSLLMKSQWDVNQPYTP